MKKILLLIAAAALAVGTMQAKTADELRIYLNPGHGSYGANDRPMNTVSHPDTYNQVESGTTTPDTLGFFEGRGTLPRAFGLGSTLVKMGVKSENIVYSRLTNGPWPTDNGESATKYNRNLAEICEEVELGNFDMFISCRPSAFPVPISWSALQPASINATAVRATARTMRCFFMLCFLSSYAKPIRCTYITYRV